MSQLDGERDGLYATVDPDSNELHHTTLEPTGTNVTADQFFTELRQKHDVDDAISLVDDAVLLHRACKNMASISDTNDMELGTVPNMSIIR